MAKLEASRCATLSQWEVGGSNPSALTKFNSSLFKNFGGHARLVSDPGSYSYLGLTSPACSAATKIAAGNKPPKAGRLTVNM